MLLMFHPGTLHATMFVSCAQRIVASYFIVAIVACVASAQRHAHGRIFHARASSVVFSALRPRRPIARLPKSGDAALSAALRALCVVDRCPQCICCYTAPYPVHFHPSWRARAADDSRGHKCADDFPMAQCCESYR